MVNFCLERDGNRGRKADIPQLAMAHTATLKKSPLGTDSDLKCVVLKSMDRIWAAKLTISTV